MGSVIADARQLIAFDSTSRYSNAAVSDWVADRLDELRFDIERIEYDDAAGVRKVCLIAKRGSGAGGMGFFAHTDCVPAEEWTGPGGAWEPVVVDGRLYGRGACDMKGPLAAILEGARRTVDLTVTQPLYIVCTADEEIGYGGAAAVVERSAGYREMVAAQTLGVIAEPTRLEVVCAHKGGVGFRVTSHGRAAHSSTQLGINANLAMIPFLAEMRAIYDETMTRPELQNEAFDPPVLSWNINVSDGGTAVNITAPRSVCTVFFRPMPGVDHGPLVERARAAAERQGLDFEPLLRGVPLDTDPSRRVVRELLEVADRDHPRRVAYATDACMFTELEELVVFGPGDVAQAHTTDEWIDLSQLERAADLYTALIERWCR